MEAHSKFTPVLTILEKITCYDYQTLLLVRIKGIKGLQYLGKKTNEDVGLLG